MICCKASVFIKLDLRSGYWQVRIELKDVPKTTMVIIYGSYKFLVMLFGLSNTSAIFRNPINNVFKDFIDKFVMVYLDNIIVYSKFIKEH